MSTATPSPLRREPQLAGQTVVVIGGTAGIGLETARLARAAPLDAADRPGGRSSRCGRPGRTHHDKHSGHRSNVRYRRRPAARGGVSVRK